MLWGRPGGTSHRRLPDRAALVGNVPPRRCSCGYPRRHADTPSVCHDRSFREEQTGVVGTGAVQSNQAQTSETCAKFLVAWKLFDRW
jgi:hypothetical protein